MSSLVQREMILNGAPQTVGASVTNTVISNVWEVDEYMAKNVSIQITTTSQTVTTAITVKLQHSYDGTNFTDVGSPCQVSITGSAGRFFIDAIEGVSADAAVMPIRPKARLVVTTGSSDSVVFSSLIVVAKLD